MCMQMELQGQPGYRIDQLYSSSVPVIAKSVPAACSSVRLEDNAED